MSLDAVALSMFDPQNPAELDQSNPEQNTWYTILPYTDNCRVYAVSMNVDDTGETLQMKIDNDGVIIMGQPMSVQPDKPYFAYLWPNSFIGELSLRYESIGWQVIKAFLVEGHNVRVQARKTTASGSGNLTGLAAYGVLKNTR